MTDKKLISSLQGLRAVAFLCVVISHCGAPWLGPWAISVFVALSGFLMVCNYYDRPRTAPGLQSAIAFSFKKIRRLYPLHLIMMAAALLFVLKGLLAQPSARGVLSCAAQLAVSIFLLQTWIPSSRFWFCLNCTHNANLCNTSINHLLQKMIMLRQIGNMVFRIMYKAVSPSQM